MSSTQIFEQGGEFCLIWLLLGTLTDEDWKGILEEAYRDIFKLYQCLRFSTKKQPSTNSEISLGEKHQIDPNEADFRRAAQSLDGAPSVAWNQWYNSINQIQLIDVVEVNPGLGQHAAALGT